jgi:hypothetical protein
LFLRHDLTRVDFSKITANRDGSLRAVRRPMHARSLSVLLRRAMIAALATPAVACGGVVDNGDAGTDATPDGPPPGCNVEKVDGATAGCGGFDVQLSGDISKCNVGGSSIPSETCVQLCGGSQWSYCTFDGGTNVLTCEGICVGRMPAKLKDATIDGDGVGEYLARAAHLEDAAVSAFAILAAELRAHGAPKSLTRSCLVARADEVRHAREVGDLARAFGVVPPRAEVGPSRVRPLAEIAIENAIEGCVRETFGALVGAWQGEHARDYRVRATMKRIARDEARHAALGWRIHEWAMTRLDAKDRARVRDAMSRAIAELEASSRVEFDAILARTLGLPNAAQAVALVAAMRAEVWSMLGGCFESSSSSRSPRVAAPEKGQPRPSMSLSRMGMFV